ncbi:hypothetical protein WJX74_004545 [Apatococcus lobatus]|uniref:ALA-interacting subunit n=1 Tax=Apatococcus lobatus TaxID=904363 RepID=A0AAW1R160_9CHLO
MPLFRKRQSFAGQNRPTNPGGTSTSTVPDAGALTASRPEKRHKWYIRLARQELKGWAPIITGNAVVIYFLVMGILLLALGIPILVGSHGVKEFTANYDDIGQLAGKDFNAKRDYMYSQGGSGTTGSVTIRVTSLMKQPVYLYYQLSKYYQNHKRYVRSRDDKQLAGVGPADAPGNRGICSPEEFLGGPNGQANPDIPNNNTVRPCGLIAWSNFNDTITLPSSFDLREDEIAWPYDIKHLYGNFTSVNYNPGDLNPPDTRYPLNTGQYRGGGNFSQGEGMRDNQHLIVWMRPAAHRTFRKLYGVIHQDIPAGTNIDVNINSRYNTYGFGGQKAIVLATTSWVGGKNNFLGVIYIIFGVLALVVAVAFLLTYQMGMMKRRRFGDPSYLSWNRHSNMIGR